jgi:hypothetical protein
MPILDPYREVEDRFTALDSNSMRKNEGATSFVEVTARPAGSAIALHSYATAANPIGIRYRSNGAATRLCEPGSRSVPLHAIALTRPPPPRTG